MKWLRLYSMAAIFATTNHQFSNSIFVMKSTTNPEILYGTHHFNIVFVKLFRSFLDNDPQFAVNNGFITAAQSTPPLCAAIFLWLNKKFFVWCVQFDSSMSRNCNVTHPYILNNEKKKNQTERNVKLNWNSWLSWIKIVLFSLD